MKTLVVEDDKGTLLLFKRLLEQRGHQVEAFEEAESAWVACQKADNFPLVILDWILPGMSGLELCRKMRTLPYGPYSFIWIITSRNQPSDLQSVLEAGANDYLTKPFDVRVLEIRIAIAERQALLLQQHKQIEEEMKASLAEKDVLLQEIHHRVKNNLQVICSLLDLQCRDITDPAALDAIRESQDRVRSMVLVHEKLYQSKDLSRIEFPAYIRHLAQELFLFYDPGAGVRLRIEGDPVFLKAQAAIPCGLIINELVTNSLKYAFPAGGKGEIFIQIENRKPGQVDLVIGDTGIGLPPGLDLANPPSLGLKLVQALVYQLKGSVAVQNGQGSLFRIAFTL